MLSYSYKRNKPFTSTALLQSYPCRALSCVRAAPALCTAPRVRVAVSSHPQLCWQSCACIDSGLMDGWVNEPCVPTWVSC